MKSIKTIMYKIKLTDGTFLATPENPGEIKPVNGFISFKDAGNYYEYSVNVSHILFYVIL